MTTSATTSAPTPSTALRSTSSYTIYVVTPRDYKHSATFHEVAKGLQEGMAELGLVARIVTDPREIRGRAIVLGANLLLPLPSDCIVFNLEQFESGWMTDQYLYLLRNHEVWDYSQRNIEQLRTKGIEAKYCGIGYEPGLTTVLPREETVDVLFYGSNFGRRLPILSAIEAMGLRVKVLFGVYGEERDNWIARSKIVLNIHAYDRAPFEIVRVSYLLANRRFVLSEPEVPEALRQGVACGRTETLPELAYFYARNPSAREGIAAEGFKLFTATRQAEYLRPLL